MTLKRAYDQSLRRKAALDASISMLERVYKAKDEGRIKDFMVFVKADDPQIIDHITIVPNV